MGQIDLHHTSVRAHLHLPHPCRRVRQLLRSIQQSHQAQVPRVAPQQHIRLLCKAG